MFRKKYASQYRDQMTLVTSSTRRDLNRILLKHRDPLVRLVNSPLSITGIQE